MRRFILLLVLPLLACSGTATPLPMTPTTISAPPTSISPTITNPPETSIATAGSLTDTPAAVTTFPDPNAYQWQMIVSGLTRPVDLQADGSGRLFIVEKPGRIRIVQDGQVLQQPFLDIDKRVGSQSNEQGLLGLAFHPQYAQN